METVRVVRADSLGRLGCMHRAGSRRVRDTDVSDEGPAILPEEVQGPNGRWSVMASKQQ